MSLREYAVRYTTGGCLVSLWSGAGGKLKWFESPGQNDFGIFFHALPNIWGNSERYEKASQNYS